MQPDAVQTLAGQLREAARTRVAIPPLAGCLAGAGVAGAYAVQQANTGFHMAQGRRRVGRKIGLTSPSVQRQLVDSPDYGALFADMAVCDGETIAIDRLQPRIEAEVALVLAKDLDAVQMTLADLISGVAYALPALEIVDSRIADWRISLLDTIADNASSGLFVLGSRPVKIETVDLRLCGMVMERRGEPVSFGCGAACLGHPLIAALWLARTMVEAGTPLGAGDIVLTGALGPMVAVAADDAFEARISGLGSVRAVFGRA